MLLGHYQTDLRRLINGARLMYAEGWDLEPRGAVKDCAATTGEKNGQDM